MKKSQLSFIIFFLLCQTTYCQDYIVKDSTYTSGTVKLLSDGSITFKKLKKDLPITYLPGEIKEFGFEGKVFESIVTNSQIKFSERIANARPLKVFVYQSQLLLKVYDSIKIVDKNELLNQVQKYSVCDTYKLPKKILSNNKSIDYNLTKLIKVCKPHKLLFNRTLFSLGINQIDIKGDGGLLTTERLSGQFTSPSLGLGKEFPFYKPSNLFLTADLNFNLLSGKVNSTNNPAKKITAHYIILPIGLKWIIADYTVKTYLKGAVVASYSSISADTGVTSSSSSSLQFGLTSAIGIQIPIQKINGIQLELKFIDLAKTSFQEYELGMTSNSFSIGYCF
ncbi:MAG: hypothetical protein ACK5RG_04710 [Cyclobacteriaceae bacterium]|jgi:hypothetical protein|nr:hypothetical protein [Flammeovirgaceae bacterium]